LLLRVVAGVLLRMAAVVVLVVIEQAQAL